MTDLIKGAEPAKIMAGDKQIIRKYIGDKKFYEWVPPYVQPSQTYVTREYQLESVSDHGFYYSMREISPTMSDWQTGLYANNGEFPDLSESNSDITSSEWE